jgi:SAM-dependent methyltransferase
VSPEDERRFFAKLRLPNGTWKTTYRHRLDDLNEWLLDFLDHDRRLDVMDVGISSGVATLEWSDQLLGSGVSHTLVAGDLDTDAYLASWGEWLAVLFNGDGTEPLLLEVGPVSLPMRSDRRLVRAMRPLLSPLLRIATRGRCRKVSLVSSDLLGRSGVEVVRDDVTVAGRYQSQFDVVRAANLVQPGYFDEVTLRRVMSNLGERLREGGLLVVCRTTEDGVNRATLFRRAGDQLESGASLNGGAEVVALTSGR